jgi:hypothetical protein
MTTIPMVTYLYGMAVRVRTIYYCTEDKGIKMLNLSDKSVSDIINSSMSGVCYVVHLKTTFTTQTLTHIPSHVVI